MIKTKTTTKKNAKKTSSYPKKKVPFTKSKYSKQKPSYAFNGDYGYIYNGIFLASVYKLNEQQEMALSIMITQFLDNKKFQTFSLRGYAGTGKSTIIGLLEQYILKSGNSVNFSAPTNRAVSVLKSKTQYSKVSTLHKLLGLKAEIDIENFDIRNAEFSYDRSRSELSSNVVVIDEASMIGDQLYDFINQILIQKFNCKIIYLGDSAQLQPVGSTRLSKALTNSDLEYELTEVMRTDSENIITLLTKIRNKQKFTLERTEDYHFTNDHEEFLEIGYKHFLELNDNENIVRVICGTNERVESYNSYYHDRLFPTSDAEYNVGELITSYNGNYELFCNSMDGIISSIEDTFFQIGDFLYKGYNISLTNRGRLKVISSNNDFKPLEKEVYRRLRANDNYQSFYELKNEYYLPFDILSKTGKTLLSKGIDYGYSITTHKSQGGTYKNVLIDIEDFKPFKRDIENYRQLLYVAFSRCSNSFIGYTMKT